LAPVAAFLSYAVLFGRPINDITSIFVQLQGALASMARVFALIDEPPEQDSGTESLTAKGHIVFENVSFSYSPNKPLIQNLSLEVKPGSTVAIVGPTGGGKTTLVNLLMRFYEPNSGRILIDGVDVQTVTRDSLRQSFGMVLQDTWLFSGSIFENIAYGKTGAAREEVEEAARKAGAHDFIVRMPQGYDTQIGGVTGNLSQGECQLLTIARAMLSSPPMLILDEATSAVDSLTEQKINRAFDLLMKGKTSFVIAHRLSTIVNSDLILVVDKGNVVQRGDHKTLSAQEGLYAELYRAGV